MLQRIYNEKRGSSNQITMKQTKQESNEHAELNDWVEDVIEHLMKTKGLQALDHAAKKLAARNDFIQWYYANEDDDVC